MRKSAFVVCLTSLPAVTLSHPLVGAESAPEFAPVKAELVRPRDGLGNVIGKLQAGETVKIAYLGGSITAAAGWRVQTRDRPVPRFDSYCTYHRIATLAVAQGLDRDEVHTVTVEIHPEQPDRLPIAKTPFVRGPTSPLYPKEASHTTIAGNPELCRSRK